MSYKLQKSITVSRNWLFIAGLGLIVTLAACGGSQAGGDPEVGEEIFNTKRGGVGFGEQLGCSHCHSLGEKRPGDGPPIGLILEDAAKGVEGMSAEEFLRQSIVDPSAYIAEGFFDNWMPKVYGELLTEEDINNLIAFMLTQ